jgi:hypothetical protein
MSQEAKSTDSRTTEFNGRYCDTVGLTIPMALWGLESDEKQAILLAKYGVKLLGSTADACDDVGVLVKTMKTVKAYKTSATVTQRESWASPHEAALHVKFKPRAEWTPRAAYLKKLKAVADRYEMPISQVILLDQSMRVKRIRSNTYGCPDSLNIKYGDKYLVLMLPDKGKTMGMWFDIALSDAVPEKGLSMHVDAAVYQIHQANMVAGFDRRHPRVPRRCGNCRKRDCAETRHNGESLSL